MKTNSQVPTAARSTRPRYSGPHRRISMGIFETILFQKLNLRPSFSMEQRKATAVRVLGVGMGCGQGKEGDGGTLAYLPSPSAAPRGLCIME